MKMHIVLLVIFSSLVIFSDAQTVRYITHDGAGSKTGTSWSNAYDATQLQSAIDETGIAQVWVTSGTYYPTVKMDAGDERSKSFYLQPGVAVYGGFAGTETLLGERDWETNETIMSGDIGTGDDISDNCYHVVFLDNATLGQTAGIDGFTIRDGYSDGENNTARGAGIYQSQGAPAFANLNITNNASISSGGGICLDAATGTTFVNISVSNNTSLDGGGLYSSNSSFTFQNSMFFQNSATGETEYGNKGGAVMMYGQTGTPVFINCIFYDNDAQYGGALFCTAANPTFTNCTFSANSASGAGGGMLNHLQTTTLNNCIIWGNTAVEGGNEICLASNESETGNTTYLNYCCYGNGADDLYIEENSILTPSNCITSDPLFSGDADNPLLIFGTSPCADAGDNSYISETYDFRGVGYDRKLNKSDGTSGTVDMGAYEFNFSHDIFGIWTWTGTGGTSWNTTTSWDIGLVPASKAGIIVADVDNNPVITNEDVSVYTLEIQSGAVLTLDATSTLTVEGDFTNTAETSGMMVESNISGTGSVIVGGSASGNITVKRYVDEFSKDEKWHYVSSPVAGQALNVDWMSSNNIGFADPAYQFFRWDEDTKNWIYFDYVGNQPEDFGDDVFMPARGYSLATTSAMNLIFEGAIRTSVVEYDVTSTSGKGEGWNLTGNPFASSIGITTNASSADNFLGNTTNASMLDPSYAALFVWDESTDYVYGRDDYKIIGNAAIGEYSMISQDYVEPGQAFMVKVSTGGTLQFTKDMMYHADAAFFKAEEKWPSVEIIVKGNNMSNTTAIGFNSGMTTGLDPTYDIGKLKGNPDLSIYTRLIDDNGVDFAIQALPDDQIEKYIIPLGMNVSATGIYEFMAITTRFDDYPVILEDRQESTFTDLRQGSCFVFVSGNGTERFFLHFKDLTGMSVQVKSPRIGCFYENGILRILNQDGENGVVTITTVTGNVIQTFPLTGTSEQEHSIHVPCGIYLISCRVGSGTLNRKILIF